MAGQPARNDEHGVDLDGVAGSGKAGGQALDGNGHAAQAKFVERPGSSVSRCALLHFDKGDDPATTGD
jgi:hypothetical protein